MSLALPAASRRGPALAQHAALLHDRRPMRAVLTRVGGWLEAIPLEYRALCALFVISRLALRALGLRYSLELNWMFLDDPARLEHHLLDSLVSFHVYPPGMNILTGLLLKLDAENIAAWAQFLYEVSGLVLSGSLLYLLRAVGLPRGWTLGVSVVFGLMPRRSTSSTCTYGVPLFCGFQICYLVLTSSLFAIGESARYRFQIEAPASPHQRALMAEIA